MPAKKTTKKSTPLARKQKSFVDPVIVVTIACIVMGGLIFVLYASAATVNTFAK